MPEQVALFHDCFCDAIGSAVQAIGGAKRASALLWPAMKPETAYTRLRHCLGEEFPEKLSPDEVLLLARHARTAGDHSVMQYLALELGYEVRPYDPDEAKARAKKARKAALLAELSRLMEDE